MREERGPWYLLTGLVLGAFLGLMYAWLVQPTQYTDTKPASLRADFKDRYRALIAAAYMSNGDLVRARARLELLQDPDLYRMLSEQAQRTLAEGASVQEARALGLLAVALGQAPSTVAAPQQAATTQAPITSTLQTEAPTPTLTLLPGATVSETVGITETVVSTEIVSGTQEAETPTPGAPNRTARPTATPTAEPSPLPTRTPSPTPGAPFALQSEELVCDPTLDEALIQVVVYDAAEQGVPGVEVIVTWEGGENHFYTGLKPEMGLGYADYLMAPDTVYTLRLAQGGQPIPNLIRTECENADGASQVGAWLLVFVQP